MGNIKLDIMSLKNISYTIHGSITIEEIEVLLEDGNVLKFFSHRTRTGYGLMEDIEDLYLVIDNEKLSKLLISNIKAKTHTEFVSKTGDKIFIRYNDLKTYKIPTGESSTFLLKRFFVGSKEFQLFDLNRMEVDIKKEILKNKTISLLNGCKYNCSASFSKKTDTNDYDDIHLYMYTSFDSCYIGNSSLFGVGVDRVSFQWDEFIKGKESQINHLYKLVYKNDDYKSKNDFFLNIFRAVEYLLVTDKNKNVKNNKFLEILDLTEKFKKEIAFPLDSYFENKKIQFWDYIFSSMSVSFRNYYSHTEENQEIYLDEEWVEHLSELFLSIFQYYLYSRWGISEEYLKYTDNAKNKNSLKFLEKCFIDYRDQNKISIENAMMAKTFLKLSTSERLKFKLRNRNFEEKLEVENILTGYVVFLKNDKKNILNSF